MARQPAGVLDRGPVVVPPTEQGLVEGLDQALDSQTQTGARLLGADGSELQLPESVYKVLVQVVHEMARGNAVSVVPVHTELTTQQAAEVLGVSRPHLISLLDKGAMAYGRPGKHRRIRLADLLAYRDQQRIERRKALDEMAAAGERLDLKY